MYAKNNRKHRKDNKKISWTHTDMHLSTWTTRCQTAAEQQGCSLHFFPSSSSFWESYRKSMPCRHQTDVRRLRFKKFNQQAEQYQNRLAMCRLELEFQLEQATGLSKLELQSAAPRPVAVSASRLCSNNFGSACHHQVLPPLSLLEHRRAIKPIVEHRAALLQGMGGRFFFSNFWMPCSHVELAKAGLVCPATVQMNW